MVHTGRSGQERTVRYKYGIVLSRRKGRTDLPNSVGLTGPRVYQLKVGLVWAVKVKANRRTQPTKGSAKELAREYLD